MSDKPVVVYGATGYTGRLVIEYLREFGVPFIAAGRDGQRVQDVVSHVPGIETADYEVREVAHDEAALTELFTGAQVVCNTVGPFIKYGPDVVRAALAAGAHYLDTTGEQDWMLAAQREFGADFAARDLLLAPCVAQMYTTSEIACNIALEVPGIDTLDVLVLWKGYPTIASTQTIFTILKADWFYLENNQYVEWDHNSNFDVVVPGQHELAIAVPWGGMAHPVWFKNDPRVSSVRSVGGILNRAVMETVKATVAMYEEQIKPLSPADRERTLSEIASGAGGSMPPRENPRLNTSLDSVYGSGPLGRTHVVIHGNQNYKQTGLLQAYCAYSLIQRAPRTVGFASACAAFGYRELLGTLRSFGLVLDPVVTTHS